METNRCLNCQSESIGKYCSECGQKTATHRITLTHFITHDLVHGLWHLDRGILFTIKEAIVRPGKAALDYIAGKRIRYYNVFYLSLLLIALNVIWWHIVDSILYDSPNPDRNNSELVDFIAQYLKVLVLCVVPLLALNGRMIFSRLKLNLPEHAILGGISLVGILMVCLLFISATLLEQMASNLGLLKVVAAILMLFYPLWTYANATKGLYSFGGFFWRAAIFTVLFLSEILLVMMGISYLFTSNSSMEINL